MYRYKKFWNRIKKGDERVTDERAKSKTKFERTFLSNHIQKYYKILDSIPSTGDVIMDKVHYCERFIELMIDLTAQLPTRRFFNTGQFTIPVVVVVVQIGFAEQG